VDVSARQLALARRRVPEARLVRGDIATVAFRDGVFHAVVALWSVIHVPRGLHEGTFRRIHAWLRPGGLFVATLGSGDNPDERSTDFFGTPMYWSHHDAETNRALLRAAGFRILRADEVEDEGETPLWVLAEA
jgi:SAM-dependent methyltransferase